MSTIWVWASVGYILVFDTALAAPEYGCTEVVGRLVEIDHGHCSGNWMCWVPRLLKIREKCV